MIGLNGDRAGRFMDVNGERGAEVSLHLEYLFVARCCNHGLVD